MATSLRETREITMRAERVTSGTNHLRERFIFNTGLTLATITFFFGTSWDVQWHAAVGRDSVFTYPHIMMIAGIALTGLLALGQIILSTAHKNQERDTFRLGRFLAPRGAYLAGFASLFSVIAFGLDDYWHQLYGIDVKIWAPFHLMIIGGILMASVAQLDLWAGTMALIGQRSINRLYAEIGLLLSAAIILGNCTFLIIESLDKKGVVTLPGLSAGYTVQTYPIFIAAGAPLVFVAVALAIRWPGAASVTALIFTAFKFLLGPFIDFSVTAMVNQGGYNYRDSRPGVALASYAMPTLFIVGALIIDLAIFVTRRYQLKNSLIPVMSGVVFALICAFINLPWVYATNGVNENYIQIIVRSVPLVIIAALISSWLGEGLGRSLAAEARAESPASEKIPEGKRDVLVRSGI